MKLTVRGVTFALFPQYDQTDPRGREMVEQTVQRLKQLDRERPEVILMPEPENVKDPKAIRVYCEGTPIGYVAHEQTDMAHLLFDTLHPRCVPARIVGAACRRAGAPCRSARAPRSRWGFPRNKRGWPSGLSHSRVRASG